MRSILLFSFTLLFSITAFCQDIPEGYKKVNHFLVPTDLLDPAYPVMKASPKDAPDAVAFEAELRTYTKKLEKLPQYVCTGDVAKDQAEYEESVRQFLIEHPYCPQPLLSNDEQRDADVFECLWKGYFKYYPDQAKRIVNVDERGGVK